MYRKIIVSGILLGVTFAFSVVMYGFLQSSKISDDATSIPSVATTSALTLSGQLYEKIIFNVNRSSSTVPLLHLTEPLEVSKQYSLEPIQYIQLVTPASIDWKSLVGSKVIVEGVLNTNFESGKSYATVVLFDVLNLGEDFSSSKKDPVLNEEDIVGMIGVNDCAVGSIVFYLSNQRTAFINQPSEPTSDSRVGYGTWNTEDVASRTPFPYKVSKYTDNISWSDGARAPGFPDECYSALHSEMMFIDSPRLMYSLGKYLPMFSPEIQEEIYRLHPTLR